jgi:peptide/nickel transport system permease protein
MEPPAQSAPSPRRRRRSLPWFPIVVLAILFIAAAFAPWLAPHDPTKIDILNARLPPGANPSFPLGTDLLGRDVLSRLIYGARSSVVIALIGLGITAVIGTALGMLAGFHGGRTDSTISRAVDVGLSFPTILAAILIAAFFGAGLTTIIVAVIVTMWAKFARMIRGDVISVRGRDFVTLATIAGVSTPKIMVRHILPNVANTLMVVTSLLLGQVILLEASLSFLGLGLPPGAPAWGIMVSEGRSVLVDAWWLALFPGLAITLVVLALNLMGDWLRDALDPRLQVLS